MGIKIRKDTKKIEKKKSNTNIVGIQSFEKVMPFRLINIAVDQLCPHLVWEQFETLGFSL